ncbi:MAG: methylisocitrate lyase [Acidothermus sp.]|nr:methylisocitrate lyase [Acidothermus sp.]
MNTPETSPAARFRAALASGRLLRFPGAPNALSALLIEELGFEGVYVSGAVVSAELGLPDIELTTLSEVAGRAHEIARVVNLPTLVDADTGFGGPLNAARTVQMLTRLGIAGCHIEDQRSPKRCGHLEGKSLVDVTEMCQRLRAATSARPDPDFVVCARTDARTVEGLDAAIDRAKAYLDAGADMIFAEALADAKEIARFRRAIEAPLLVNMTEFGRSELLPVDVLADLGVNVVIYPVTLLRIAMGAIEEALRVLAREGTQASMVPRMQTRARLYELVRYREYAALDADVFNFTVPGARQEGEHDG